MEMLGLIALAVLLVLVLALLVYAWGWHVERGGFWNFWIAWNLADTAGHVFTLLLAVIGIQSILNYETRQRTREIGIRIALGAGREQILRRVVGRGFMLAGLGILIGSAGALGSARVLTALLFGIAPTDAGTFVTVATFIAALALAASYFPARRATRIDPTQALRSE